MRKLLLAIALIEILLVTACNSVISDDIQSPSETVTFEHAYISLEISAPSTFLSRADDIWGYLDGSDKENNVNLIRFYFFDNDGLPVKVRKGTEDNPGHFCFHDWSPEDQYEDSTEENPENSGDGTRAGNIEKTINATLDLELESGKYPTRIVAIVNPNPLIIPYVDPDLSELKTCVGDFLTNLTENNFVMTNSAYVETSAKGRNEICETHISKSDLFTDIDAAKTHPVSIFVERIVARLDLGFSMEEDEELPQALLDIPDVYKTHVAVSTDDQEEPADVYVQILGWAITSTPKQSRLLKSIAKSWNDDLFFDASKSWNAPEANRSFWAINPPFIPSNAKNDYYWYSFNDISGDGDNQLRAAGCAGMNVHSTYMLENANPPGGSDIEPANPDYPSKVICAGRLIDSDGVPISLALYDSKYYSIDGLKREIADKLEMYSPSSEDPNTYDKISYLDISFETAEDHFGTSGPDQVGSYFVYCILNENAATKNWYRIEESSGSKEAVIIDNPDSFIEENTLPAQIWDNGNTYYFFDIPHYGENRDDPGYFGVVRNHIYNASVVKITSLGNPVYNPNQVIFPEPPQTIGNSLEFNVRILQWRLVKKNLQLAW